MNIFKIIVILLLTFAFFILYIYKFTGLSRKNKMTASIINIALMVITAIFAEKELNNSSIYFIFEFIIFQFLYCMSIEDIIHKSIHSVFVYIFMAICVIGGLINPYGNFVVNMISGVIISVLMVLFYFLSKKEIGIADIKIIIALSFFLGISAILRVVFMGLIISLVVGVLFIIFKKKNLKYEMPFIPFLLIGLLIHYTEFYIFM